ncbi:MAG: hypothetical protein ABR899_02965 [Candidatus Krumholzibacteriaceae bacterium]|jgi:hypothetical protein
MIRAIAGKMEARAPVIACALLLMALPAPARSEDRPDTSLVYRWSAVYRNRIDVERSSPAFPWNDEESSSYFNDRLAILGELAYGDHLSLFGKGATGFRLGGDYQDEQFILDQAHVGFDLLGGAVTGRLFSRERVYRLDQKLLTIVSDESGLVDHGEGLSFQVNAGAHASLNYVGSVVRIDTAIRGGLPSFQPGAGNFQVLRLEALRSAHVHAGLTVSDFRVDAYGRRITVGTDAGVGMRGIDLFAELVRTQRGGWDEVRGHTLFDLNWDEASLGNFGALFSPDDAFSAEIEGLRLELGGLGAAGLIPGYRFYGRDFQNPLGGYLPHGLDESYALAWWKPARYDAMVSIDASSGTSFGEDLNRLVASVRTRYRGGFEVRESVLCRTGQRSSGVVSFLDDNALSRLVMTARMDDPGAGNLLSYLLQGTFNLGSRVSAKSALYLYRSRTSLYNVGLEFRPRERFLFQAALGSFTPQYEGLTMEHDFDLYAFDLNPPSNERFIQFFTRIWFGGEGAR